MIKDEKLRNELFAEFPTISNEEAANIRDDYFEHYSLYKRIKVTHHSICGNIKADAYKCYCTRCANEYTLELEPGYASIKHKSKGICPECGKPVTYLAEGRGRKYIRENNFFAVFHVVDGNLFISCYDVFKKFISDRQLAFDWVEIHRYSLTPDGAQHWEDSYELHNNHWMKQWKPLKSENARDYVLINREVVSETFLKYADEIAFEDIPHRYIAYLCMCSNHPNIEYLIKTGFGYIIRDKLLSGQSGGIRINYRSNNVKKMLGLNKAEMKMLKDKSSEVLSAYLTFRKLDKRTSEIVRASASDVYRYYSHCIADIMKITGISLQKVINYMEEQGGIHAKAYDWKDYLRQCQQLEYDISDTLVTMPKDLTKAHARLTRIIKIKIDELAKKEFEENIRKRKKFEYVSRDGAYHIFVPQSIQQIIDEGKRLDHCVGGYADRHAKGKLTILFLRTSEKPDVPYYTMEVDTKGHIVQCRGFKNNCAGNPKPQEIINFEQEYQEYLDKLFKRKRRKTA